MSQVETAAAWLRSAARVAVLTGAGVSAESGIPTFRGLGGFWQGYDPMTLATPEAFAWDPVLVWEFYHWRRRLVIEANPNPAHFALVRLALLVPHLTLITQNVDQLHQRSGSRGVLEIHGNLIEARCTVCHHLTSLSGGEIKALPICELCGNLLRPAVVWFGEGLPTDVWEQAQAAVNAADVLFVIGTSSIVYPAAGLATLARRQGHRVIEVNLDPTPISDSADLSLQGPAGTLLPQIIAAFDSQDIVDS